MMVLMSESLGWIKVEELLLMKKMRRGGSSVASISMRRSVVERQGGRTPEAITSFSTNFRRKRSTKQLGFVLCSESRFVVYLGLYQVAEALLQLSMGTLAIVQSFCRVACIADSA